MFVIDSANVMLEHQIIQPLPDRPSASAPLQAQVDLNELRRSKWFLGRGVNPV